jgi:hypothetical protein
MRCGVAILERCLEYGGVWGSGIVGAALARAPVAKVGIRRSFNI